jgi:hypothetical protein
VGRFQHEIGGLDYVRDLHRDRVRFFGRAPVQGLGRKAADDRPEVIQGLANTEQGRLCDGIHGDASRAPMAR